MQGVPDEIFGKFMERLERSQVPVRHHAEYVQWLRYYLNFSTKYRLPDSKADRVRLFCEKLKSKDKNADEQRRAAHAVSLYFATSRNEQPGSDGNAPHQMPDLPTPVSDLSVPEPHPLDEVPATTASPLPHPFKPAAQTSGYLAAGYVVTSESPEWDTGGHLRHTRSRRKPERDAGVYADTC